MRFSFSFFYKFLNSELSLALWGFSSHHHLWLCIYVENFFRIFIYCSKNLRSWSLIWTFDLPCFLLKRSNLVRKIDCWNCVWYAQGILTIIYWFFLSFWKNIFHHKIDFFKLFACMWIIFLRSINCGHLFIFLVNLDLLSIVYRCLNGFRIIGWGRFLNFDVNTWFIQITWFYYLIMLLEVFFFIIIIFTWIIINIFWIYLFISIFA